MLAKCGIGHAGPAGSFFGNSTCPDICRGIKRYMRTAFLAVEFVRTGFLCQPVAVCHHAAGRPMSELDIYAKQGFAKSVGIGERPALVIGGFRRWASPTPRISAAAISARPSSRRSAAGRGARTRLAGGAYQGRLCRATDRTRGLHRKAPGLLKLTETSPLSQIVKELTPASRRTRAAQAAGVRIFRHGIRGLARVAPGGYAVRSTGCTTSGCVRATVVDAVSAQYAHHRRDRLRRRSRARDRTRRTCSTWARNMPT